jgi:hypothetical protein
MNLNSNLPQPTAPRADKPPANSPVQDPASRGKMLSQAVRSLWLDFAQLMAKQLQQLPASQRQTFAATSDAIHANIVNLIINVSLDFKR